MKVVRTEFCISVGGATTLLDVTNMVQRGLLDPMGYLLMSGLRDMCVGMDECGRM